MTTHAERERFKLRNKTKPCAAPGCAYHRNGIGRYCWSHEARRQTYGHFEGKPLDRKALNRERSGRIEPFLEKHSDKPQVKAAVALLDEYLSTDGFDAPNKRVRDHISRLRNDGLTGRELLSVVGGVFSLHHHDPRLLPDARRLAFALGTAVLGSRPWPKFQARSGALYKAGVPGGIRRTIGEFILTSLSPFFTNVMAKLEKDYRNANAQALLLRQPFI